MRKINGKLQQNNSIYQQNCMIKRYIYRIYSYGNNISEIYETCQ